MAEEQLKESQGKRGEDIVKVQFFRLDNHKETSSSAGKGTVTPRARQGDDPQLLLIDAAQDSGTCRERAGILKGKSFTITMCVIAIRRLKKKKKNNVC